MNYVDSVDQAIKSFKTSMRNFRGLTCRLKGIFYYIANNARIAYCSDHNIDTNALPFRNFLESVVEEVSGVKIAEATEMHNRRLMQIPHYPDVYEKSQLCWNCNNFGSRIILIFTAKFVKNICASTKPIIASRTGTLQRNSKLCCKNHHKKKIKN